MIFEIGNSAPPYIIFCIAISLLTLLSSYVIYLLGSEAPIWEWKKGTFSFFVWVLILSCILGGLIAAELIFIIFKTPVWWQFLVKCLLALSFFTLVFLISELIHFIKDTRDS